MRILDVVALFLVASSVTAPLVEGGTTAAGQPVAEEDDGVSNSNHDDGSLSSLRFLRSTAIEAKPRVKIQAEIQENDAEDCSSYYPQTFCGNKTDCLDILTNQCGGGATSGGGGCSTNPNCVCIWPFHEEEGEQFVVECRSIQKVLKTDTSSTTSTSASTISTATTTKRDLRQFCGGEQGVCCSPGVGCVEDGGSSSGGGVLRQTPPPTQQSSSFDPAVSDPEWPGIQPTKGAFSVSINVKFDSFPNEILWFWEQKQNQPQDDDIDENESSSSVAPSVLVGRTTTTTTTTGNQTATATTKPPLISEEWNVIWSYIGPTYWYKGLQGKLTNLTITDLLPNTYYRFSIMDTMNDGICCGQYGNGWITITNQTGIVWTTNGNNITNSPTTVLFFVDNNGTIALVSSSEEEDLDDEGTTTLSPSSPSSLTPGPTPPTTTNDDVADTCTRDVFFCPDGTPVGRDANNECAFYPCPPSTPPAITIFGVTFDTPGSETSLRLHAKDLTGTIPSQLGLLTGLTNLELWGNKLTGAIPSQVGQLTKLMSLSFWSNQLVGQIPSQLGLLTGLTSLNLGINSLEGPIPTHLQELTSLIWLDLYDNDFTGSVPQEICQLSSLQHISHCISDPWNCQCNNNNNKCSVADSCTPPPPPPTITIFGTYLVAFTETHLELGAKGLTGPIPSQLAILTSLTHLGLWGNELTGTIPSQLGGLTRLSSMSFWSNQLVGQIPTQLGLLTVLTSLNLSINSLTGPIPTQLQQLTELIWLELYENYLSGSVPQEICQLSNLQHISYCDADPWNCQCNDGGNNNNKCAKADSCSRNPVVTTPFPTPLPTPLPTPSPTPPPTTDFLVFGEVWDRNNEKLSKIRQDVTGTIPHAIGELTALTTISVWENRISGTIPSTLGLLTQLTYLDLHDNLLTGPIPSQLGLLTQLTWLSLSINGLTGKIPTELERLVNLNKLFFYRNPLTGVVPVKICTDISSLVGVYHCDYDTWTCQCNICELHINC